MLAIRMQRTGRSGHAMFRVVVQDSRRTPTSGKIVAQLGSYDPHAKSIILDKEKAAFYLEHGAQPSDRVVRLLQSEDIKLPGWVNTSAGKKRDVKNPDKRRSTRPEEPVAETPEEPTAPAEAAENEPATEAEQTPSADTEPAAKEESPENTNEPEESKEPSEEAAEEKPAESNETAADTESEKAEPTEEDPTKS